jgi:hypothetical protein
MAVSEAFDFVCAQLEEHTSLDRLAARGTVRLALKNAGLEPNTVSADQMAVVVEKVLPEELSARGVDGDICSTMLQGLKRLAPGAAPETPDAVFKRLGGG